MQQICRNMQKYAKYAKKNMQKYAKICKYAKNMQVYAKIYKIWRFSNITHYGFWC